MFTRKGKTLMGCTKSATEVADEGQDENNIDLLSVPGTSRNVQLDDPSLLLDGQKAKYSRRKRAASSAPFDNQASKQLRVVENVRLGNANSSNVEASTKSAFQHLADVLEATLIASRESASSERNTSLLSRRTTAKALSAFSGNPLEQQRFQNAYTVSSESGTCTNGENITRLFAALQGERRKNVSNLLATGRDADAVMETLELHYGNKHVLAKRIVDSIRDLPSLDIGQVGLTQFDKRRVRVRKAI